LLFRIARHQGERYLLSWSIRQHAYDKSRSCAGENRRGQTVRCPAAGRPRAAELAYSIRQPPFSFPDKIFPSIRPAEIYDLRLPLIVIGPAGSGKTASPGKDEAGPGADSVRHLSPYLVENSRNLYYASTTKTRSGPDFLSFREYLETLRVPEGREVSYSQFSVWLGGFPSATGGDPQAVRGIPA